MARGNNPMSTTEITVNMDKKCAECGKPGSTPCGICLKCVTKAIMGKPMKSIEGRALQERIRKF